MPPERVRISDQSIDRSHVLAIIAYVQPFDPAWQVWKDLNSAVFRTRCPHRVAAGRDSLQLAANLGFFYLSLDRIALNMKWKTKVETVCAKDDTEARR